MYLSEREIFKKLSTIDSKKQVAVFCSDMLDCFDAQLVSLLLVEN
jgi:hypothetical protein